MLHSKQQQSRVSLVHRARLCAGGTGQPMVDRLLTDLADELEQVTDRQRPPLPRELTSADLSLPRHPSPRPMTVAERRTWARYDAAIQKGASAPTALRYGTTYEEVAR